MLSITLLEQDEYRWLGDIPAPVRTLFPAQEGTYPLYHQWLTYNAEESVIINTYNTGTGKTKAALLRLLKRAEARGKDKITPTRDNVLLIAPTNELIAQHAKDAADFCQQCDLPYRVLQITREKLEKYPLHGEEAFQRPKRLHYLLTNASQADNDLTKRATIYVVNPDIFYYAIYFRYNKHDQHSLFDDFISLFNYIIIDEFHYYSPKQLASFLFFMKLSQDLGYIESTSKKRQFCILTATPRPQIKHYLEHLHIPLRWIEPEQPVPSEDRPYIEPVRALTRVSLQAYPTEELQQGEHISGLLQLVRKERERLRAWLDAKQDGAIISSSLGMISHIHQVLVPSLPKEMMGRITGAEQRSERVRARECPLILATPTVDIGFNFERAQVKTRQNIDFLFCDASSGDELVQRIGRAGRVLAKTEKEHISQALVVLDTHAYQILKPYDGMALERSCLATLAQEMNKRNDLYTYIKTGAILEAFRPIKLLKQGMSDTERDQFDSFFADLQRFFVDKEEASQQPLKFTKAQRMIARLDEWQRCYSRLHNTIPQEAFDTLPLLIDERIPWQPETFKDTRTKACLEAFYKRLEEVGPKAGQFARDMLHWLQDDLGMYYKEQARFSFRESFQPPLALAYDPNELHSSRQISTYNALHFLKYYEATFYETLAEWEQHTRQTARDIQQNDTLTYCHLHRLRESPLRIGLKLDARDYTRDAWEERFAYQVTTLYGLELLSLNEHNNLKRSVRKLFSSQYVPAFVVANGSESRTRAKLHNLRKQARFYPLPLEVTFCDGRYVSYDAVLGTMAFQVCAELPHWILIKDRRATQREDDGALIC